MYTSACPKLVPFVGKRCIKARSQKHLQKVFICRSLARFANQDVQGVWASQALVAEEDAR